MVLVGIGFFGHNLRRCRQDSQTGDGHKKTGHGTHSSHQQIHTQTRVMVYRRGGRGEGPQQPSPESFTTISWKLAGSPRFCGQWLILAGLCGLLVTHIQTTLPPSLDGSWVVAPVHTPVWIADHSTQNEVTPPLHVHTPLWRRWLFHSPTNLQLHTVWSLAPGSELPATFWLQNLTTRLLSRCLHYLQSVLWSWSSPYKGRRHNRDT